MQEFEVKFLDIDVEAITAKLISLGAVKEFDGEIKPSIFDKKGKSLRAKGQLLRLRKKGDLVELAFKQKLDRSDVKLYDETEVYVSDFEKASKILRALGFIEDARMAKHRISYSLGKAKFEFDTFPSIPTFLEIEAGSLQDLNDAVIQIGLDIKDAKPWSGRDVLRHYGKK
jgi:adenylate cyclase, class 2